MAFVASPGDLPAEREALRRAAQSVNDTVGRRFGLSLVVEGWEQVQPALGRPQSVINPRVDDCDVFVGLLNRRWGTPTGEYSSGFEEEFERALRRADGPGPSVALFFKRLTVDDTSDPGPQLQQVLGFQQRVRDERTALYESFATTDGFAPGRRRRRQRSGRRVPGPPVTRLHLQTPLSWCGAPPGPSVGELVPDRLTGRLPLGSFCSRSRHRAQATRPTVEEGAPWWWVPLGRRG